MVKRGGRRSPEEEVLSERVTAAFSEEATNPCREPVWPRALDNPKLPFWGFLSSWCLAQGAGQQSRSDTSWQRRWAGADSLAPCTFALNAGLGRRMAQKGNVTVILSGTASEPRSWWTWTDPWGRTWLLGYSRHRGAAYDTGRSGPGPSEMTVCFLCLLTFGKKARFYREHSICRSFWTQHHTAQHLDVTPWWDLR